jgi:hypothetical protein
MQDLLVPFYGKPYPADEKGALAGGVEGREDSDDDKKKKKKKDKKDKKEAKRRGQRLTTGGRQKVNGKGDEVIWNGE